MVPTRAKYGPNRPSSAPNLSSTRPASTMAAAGTSRSLVVHTIPDDHVVAVLRPAATRHLNPLPNNGFHHEIPMYGRTREPDGARAQRRRVRDYRPGTSCC